MEFSKEFIDAIREQNILRLKLIIKNSLVLDPSGKSFDKMLSEVKRNIPDFLDNHDGELFKPNTDWNEDYFNEQTVKVVDNFSKERIELLQKMVQKLYMNKSVEVHNETSIKTKSVEHAHSMALTSMQKAGMAVATVGAVTVIAGLAIKAPIVLTLIGGVAVVAGGVMYLAGRES